MPGEIHPPPNPSLSRQWMVDEHVQCRTMPTRAWLEVRTHEIICLETRVNVGALSGIIKRGIHHCRGEHLCGGVICGGERIKQHLTRNHTCARERTCMHTHKSVCAHTHTQARTRIDTNTHTNTHNHKHTRACALSQTHSCPSLPSCLCMI